MPEQHSADPVCAVYLLLQTVEKRQSVVSVHATRESAEQHRREGDVIQKWAVRHIDAEVSDAR